MWLWLFLFQVETLTVSKSVERTLPENSIHEYALQLNQGDIFFALINQHGLDVQASLLKDGEQISQFVETPTDVQGLEGLAMRIREDGNYRLRIRGHASTGGVYRLTLKHAGPPTREASIATTAFEHFDLVLANKALQENGLLARRLFKQLNLKDLSILVYVYQIRNSPSDTAQTLISEARTQLDQVDPRWPAALAVEQALILRDIYQPDAWLGALTEALDLAGQNGDHYQIARVLTMMGSAYYQLGRIQQSAFCHNAALNALAEYPAAYLKAVILTRLADAYLFAGEPETARDCLKRAAEIWRIKHHRRKLADAESLIGMSFDQEGNYLKAETWLRQAASRLDSLERSHTHGNVLDRLAANCLNRGEIPEAIELLERARNMYESPVSQAIIDIHLAKSYRLAGKMEQARQKLNPAIDRLKDLPYPDARFSGEFQLALLHVDEPDRARAHIERAAAHLDQLWRNHHGPFLNRAFTERIYGFYAFRIGQLLEQGTPSSRIKAHELVERRRVSFVMPMYHLRHGNIVQQAQTQKALNQALANASELGPKIRAHLLQLDQIYAQNRSNRKDFEIWRIPKIQQRILDQNSVMLSFWRNANGFLLWEIHHDKFFLHEIHAGDILERNVMRLLALQRRPHPGNQKRARFLSTKIAAALFADCAERLRTKEQWLIIPDGALHQLSLDSLQLPGAKQPVCANHGLRYVEAASLAEPVIRARYTKILAVANPGPNLTQISSTSLQRPLSALELPDPPPLPFAAKEAAMLKEIAPQTEVRIGVDATKEQPFNDYDLIHLATHSFIHPERPELSGLLLHDAEQGPVYLRGFELGTVDASLVVLSACESGAGLISPGAGHWSLPMLLRAAGADHVIASIWPVYDASSEVFMRHFYGFLLSERFPPIEALRRAKMAMREEKRWSAPAYWAGYTLHGPRQAAQDEAL